MNMSKRDLLIQACVEFRYPHEHYDGCECEEFQLYQLWKSPEGSAEYYGNPIDLIDGLLDTDAGRLLLYGRRSRTGVA